MNKIMSPATEKENRAVSAAQNVFLRYGYAHTTMGDIAQAAKMSRPALYLLFANKDEIFAAVIRRMTDKLVHESRQVLVNYPSFEARLLFVCEKWAVEGFEFIERYPDAADMFNLKFAPVQEMYAESQKLIAEVLAEPVQAAGIDSTAEELARLLTYSFLGFKSTAVNGADMRRLVQTQVALFVRSLA